MQGLCKELGNKFNQQGAPKRVEFLMAWVLQLNRNNESVVYGLEPFIGTFYFFFLLFLSFSFFFHFLVSFVFFFLLFLISPLKVKRGTL
jgi:hypothetical protein